MKAPARQHHLVPAFYLAGFTDTGTVEGRLHVFDYVRDLHYDGSPRTVGRERDFFRIYEPGHDPNSVECELARVESEYGTVLTEIRTEGRLYRPHHARVALGLAALIRAKTKRCREQLAKTLVGSIHRKLVAGEVKEEQWESLRRAQIRAGIDPQLVPPYQEVLQLIERGTWRPPPPQVLLVGLVGEVQQIIFEMLIMHDWELMRTDPETNGGFITSDCPLVWGDIPTDGTVQNEAALWDPMVEVTFPLAKSAALVAHHGAREANFQATDEIVAHVNSRTLFLSTGTVFFASKDFLLEQRTGIGKSSDYFSYVRKARKRGITRP